MCEKNKCNICGDPATVSLCSTCEISEDARKSRYKNDLIEELVNVLEKAEQHYMPDFVSLLPGVLSKYRNLKTQGLL